MHFFLVVLLAQVAGVGRGAPTVNRCDLAMALEVGQVSPCSGVLWSIKGSKAALECQRVSLPLVTQQLEFCKAAKKAEVDALMLTLHSAETSLELMPEPTPKITVIVAGLAAVVVSFLGGYAYGALQ